MSDIDTAVVDGLKALDPKRPIREADIERPLPTNFRFMRHWQERFTRPCSTPSGPDSGIEAARTSSPLNDEAPLCAEHRGISTMPGITYNIT